MWDLSPLMHNKSETLLIFLKLMNSHKSVIDFLIFLSLHVFSITVIKSIIHYAIFSCDKNHYYPLFHMLAMLTVVSAYQGKVLLG